MDMCRWEKLIHTHHLTWWIRIPSRIPVLAAIWVVSTLA